ncbi:MAG: patatin-like phospholipase family protein [Nonlabens sp.]
MKNEKEPIRIGLVLAGAVTAGAFTAGVMDYLLNTLKRWHEEYEKRPHEVPEPNVIIDVITGASAGGITAAVTTLGLTIDKLDPVTTSTGKTAASDNVLFDTWVNFGKPANENILGDLFSLDDLKDKEVHSLLNTNFITNLMEKLIDTTKDVMSKKQEKVNVTSPPLPAYINPQLEVLMTLSNLRGIPIDLHFTENKSKVAHTMEYHKAYAHFEVGTDVLLNKLPLDLSEHEHLKLFLDVARASGAFPIGLKSVPFKGIPKEYIAENIKQLFGNNEKLTPLVDDKYSFLATDGGMTNNEPLAEALRILKKKGDNYRLILIDPFPGRVGDQEDEDYSVENDNIFQVIPQLFSTLRNQALFKEKDIMDLFDPGSHKNMIWPTRYGKNRKIHDNSIACGALSGFAGFISRDFRYHDYMLGQKNAQNFLRFYFNSSEDLDRWNVTDREFFGLVHKKTGKDVMPIIPDYSIEKRALGDYGVEFLPALHKDPLFPEFPSVEYSTALKKMEEQMSERIKEVVKISFNHLKKPTAKENVHPIIKRRNRKGIFGRFSSWIGRGLGNGFMSLVGIRKLSATINDKIMNTIIQSLSDYGLLKE